MTMDDSSGTDPSDNIRTTDNQIDKLTYELSVLSDDEIAIAEGM